MKDKTDILIIAAHPDDAEFGVAGSVANWTRSGKQVVYVICTSGDKGSSDPNVDPERLARTREKEQARAAEVLGVNRVKFLGYPDQGVEDTPEFRKEIVRQIRMFRPDMVISSDPYRRYIWHRDHRITGQVVLDAVFPFARDHLAYPDLIEEGLMPHKVKEILFWGAEDNNLRLDITSTFDIKLKALFCHESQIKDTDQKRVEKWLRERCRDMARETDFALAEAFHQVITPP